MLLGGLQKLTLIDYPGKVACTVFTVGCNFRCPFCHNPELVTQRRENDRKDAKEKEGVVDFSLRPMISEELFFNFLSERKGILDGVCVTGGEPTVHADLEIFLRKIKEMGFLVKLDTNGTNPEILKKLLDEKLLDYIAMDLKNNFKSNYAKTAGVEVNIEDIKKSVEIIRNRGGDYEFRTTVVPGLHTKEDLLAIADEIKGAKKYYLQQFKHEQKMLNPDFREVTPYGKDFLEDIREKIKDYFEVCEVRGE